jgi:hypothetical protein
MATGRSLTETFATLQRNHSLASSSSASEPLQSINNREEVPLRRNANLKILKIYRVLSVCYYMCG